jgi:aminoglycoside/choline kinase family phosphotransferase
MKSQDDMIGFAREALGLSESTSTELFPFEGRGSDRAFFRLRWSTTAGHSKSQSNDHVGRHPGHTMAQSAAAKGRGLDLPGWDRKDSAVLVHYDPKRVENTYYADIAGFLRDIDVPVPRLMRHDPAGCLIVMEDLGDTDLWSLRKTPWETRRALYQKTLTIVHRLHSFPEKDFPLARVRLMEGFGPDLYRWERDYFRDHFVRDACGIELEPALERELEAELSSLAERLAAGIGCLVHRDLQSQNVMIRDGKPFLIDFQGMRFGSPFYDLGSLLCDPYVDFSGSEQDELLSFYFGLSKWDLDWFTFQNCFWEASAQRLVQALGAFGFLGLKKGLNVYLEHIPAGLRHLQLTAGHVTSLSRLRQVSLACQKVIEQKGYGQGCANR